MAREQPPTRFTWHVGQRVKRMRPRLHGTVVSVDGRMKVRWDTGAVNYYGLLQSRTIKPIALEERKIESTSD
jgi:hypothetical protein